MPALLENKKAYFNYEILEKYEAGLELRGYEVKSLKNRQGNITGARVLVRGGETFVVGMDIPPYQPKNTPKDYEPQRTRKQPLRQLADKIMGASSLDGLGL